LLLVSNRSYEAIDNDLIGIQWPALEEMCDRRRRSRIRASGPVMDKASAAATAEGFPYALRQTWPGHRCRPHANMCRTPRLVAIGRAGEMVVVIEEGRKIWGEVWSKQERARLTEFRCSSRQEKIRK
jgi:hypothetical protein